MSDKGFWLPVFTFSPGTFLSWIYCFGKKILASLFRCFLNHFAHTFYWSNFQYDAVSQSLYLLVQGGWNCLNPFIFCWSITAKRGCSSWITKSIQLKSTGSGEFLSCCILVPEGSPLACFSPQMFSYCEFTPVMFKMTTLRIKPQGIGGNKNEKATHVLFTR